MLQLVEHGSVHRHFLLLCVTRLWICLLNLPLSRTLHRQRILIGLLHHLLVYLQILLHLLLPLPLKFFLSLHQLFLLLNVLLLPQLLLLLLLYVLIVHGQQYFLVLLHAVR